MGFELFFEWCKWYVSVHAFIAHKIVSFPCGGASNICPGTMCWLEEHTGLIQQLISVFEGCQCHCHTCPYLTDTEILCICHVHHCQVANALACNASGGKLPPSFRVILEIHFWSESIQTPALRDINGLCVVENYCDNW